MPKKFIGNVKGVGVASAIREYNNSTSTTVAPAVDDKNWQSTVPSLDSTHYLWTRLKLTLTNGKVEITDPIREGMFGEEIANLTGLQQTQSNKLNTIAPSNVVNVAHGGTGSNTSSGALKNFGLTATATELNYCDGVTSNIQTQLNNKSESNHTHDDRYFTESEITTKLAGKQNSLGFTPIQQGGGTSQLSNKIYIGWTGSKLNAQVDTTNMGALALESWVSSNYLKLSGGTLTGTLTGPSFKSSGNALDLYGGLRTTTDTSARINLYVTNNEVSNVGVGLASRSSGVTDCTCFFRPHATGNVGLGSSSLRWYRLWAANSCNTSSDEREKSNITSIADYPVTWSRNGSGNVFEKLFNKLVPKTYTLNVEQSDEIHMGFIAQDVAAAFEELGLSEDDLGFISHDYWTDEETGEEKDRYGLAYEEFIALNTYMIQKQQATIKALEERIEGLEGLVN